MATLTKIEQFILFTFQVDIGVGNLGNLVNLQPIVNKRLSDNGISKLESQNLSNYCERLKELGYLRIRSYNDYEITQEGSRAITLRNDL